VSSEHTKERRRALERVAEHGWRLVDVNPRRGYARLHCGCGEHVEWLPKTPSLPSTFRRKADHMIRTCSTKGDDAR
jgi:hypothetical protein